MRLSVRLWGCALAAVLPASIGCGTSALEARIDAQAAQLQKQMKYRDLDPVERQTVIATFPKQPGSGVRIQFRKPMHFITAPMTEASTDPNNPALPLNVEIVKPPFLQNFPGFRFSYERTEKQMSGTGISFLYVGAQVADPAAGDQILAQLKTAFPDLETLAWANASYETPEGGKIDWKTLTINQAQNFWFPGNNTPAPLAATFQLQMHESQGYQVFLGWRYTNTPPNPEKFAALIPAAAGTVAVQSGVPVQ